MLKTVMITIVLIISCVSFVTLQLITTEDYSDDVVIQKQFIIPEDEYIVENYFHLDDRHLMNYLYISKFDGPRGISTRINISVVSGGNVDVYRFDIFKYEEYINYTKGQYFYTFDPAENVSRHGYNSVYGNFKEEDLKKVLFVIDNRDNNRENDAKPNGTVVVNVTISQKVELTTYEEVTFMNNVFKYIICPIIPISIIIEIWYVKKIKTRPGF